jgi:alpha-ketoglutarate-dependent taurine dioxygenase
MVTITLPQAGQPCVVIEANTAKQLSQVQHDMLITLYREHGAILFRGFETDLLKFKDFASSFCVSSVFNESPNRSLLDNEAQIQSVDDGVNALEFHPELAREPWKPDVCFFFCLTPPATQGETFICDGIALVDAFSREVRNAIFGRRLLYSDEAGLGQLEFWLGTAFPTDAQLNAPPPNCPYSFARQKGRVMRSFSRPALHYPMFSDRLAFGNFLLFARFHHQKRDFPIFDDGSIVCDSLLYQIRETAARVGVPISWKRGDILMLDNTRFMHGRAEITDPTQRVIASYFGYLNFAIPQLEEIPNAPWRRHSFRPPVQGRVIR